MGAAASLEPASPGKAQKCALPRNSKKLKMALGAKTKKRKQELEQQTSISAIAATTATGLIPEMELTLYPIAALKGLKRRARKSEK